MKFAIAEKSGMTRVFDAEGKSIAVTIVRILPMSVSQVKKTDKDGYSALQIKASDKVGDKEKVRKITEIRLDDVTGFKDGDVIKTEFIAGELVNVTGTGKGKGFAGTIKRHGFKRGPEGHGGNNVREPGSIGAQQPQRVVLGRKMAGRLGGETVCVKNLKIIDLDKEIMLIAGAIPGSRRTILRIVAKELMSKQDEAVNETVSEE